MPTCSTSKLPAKYQTGGGGLFHKRYRRPQSCKYDTYRVRSRRSQVNIVFLSPSLLKMTLTGVWGTTDSNDKDKDNDNDSTNEIKVFHEIKIILRWMRHCSESHSLVNCSTEARVWRRFQVEEVRINLSPIQHPFMSISININIRQYKCQLQ